MNIYSTIERYVEENQNKSAIIFGHRRETYGKFHRTVERLSAGFRKLGLKKGDRVALLMNNCPEVIYSVYAAWKLGAISVGLNVMFKKEELDYIIGDATPDVVITQHAFLPIIETVDRVQKGELNVVVAGDGATISGEVIFFESLLASEKDDFPETLDLGPDDEAVIGYTSGTTGFPKGAVHTHRNVLLHLDGMSQALHLGDTDIFLAALPFFQLTAFLVHAGLAFHVGATLVVMEKFEPKPFLKYVHREKVTFFSGVPTIYQMLFDEGRGKSDLFKTLRFCICAGSPLSQQLRSDFENEMNLRIVHAYGSTETPLIAAFERPNEAPKGISVGNISPHVSLRIVKPDGTAAAPGEAGEIQIRSDNALKCYWNNSGATCDAIREGWFSTGDVGVIDSEGHLHIVDRAKDMIIRGGFNIYPAEIERVLLDDPRIKEVAVVGEYHKRLGEIPKAYVVPEAGTELTAADVISITREKLAKFKVVEKVEFVSEDFFPRNALGKIQKIKLKQKLV